MHKCSSTILYAACTFRPYKSTPVLKLFHIFTGKMTRGLSLRMVFSLLFVDTLLLALTHRFSLTQLLLRFRTRHGELRLGFALERELAGGLSGMDR